MSRDEVKRLVGELVSDQADRDRLMEGIDGYAKWHIQSHGQLFSIMAVPHERDLAHITPLFVDVSPTCTLDEDGQSLELYEAYGAWGGYHSPFWVLRRGGVSTFVEYGVGIDLMDQLKLVEGEIIQ